jgi:hypothetical protein
MATQKVTRQEVYTAIDSERDYQDSRYGLKLSGERPASEGEGGNRTLDEFILYIQNYAHDVGAFASTSSDWEQKLHKIRKVAGLCVAAMEQHGAPHR